MIQIKIKLDSNVHNYHFWAPDQLFFESIVKIQNIPKIEISNDSMAKTKSLMGKFYRTKIAKKFIFLH